MNAATETRWFKLDGDREGLPEWQARAALRDGVLYLPAMPLMLSESIAMALLASDGTEFLMNDGHVYVPVDWLKTYRPDVADELDHVRRHQLDVILRQN